MWTKEEAIEYVQKKWLPSGNECKGESFSFVGSNTLLTSATKYAIP